MFNRVYDFPGAAVYRNGRVSDVLYDRLVKAFMDIATGREPRFLGKTIPIAGSGLHRK